MATSSSTRRAIARRRPYTNTYAEPTITVTPVASVPGGLGTDDTPASVSYTVKIDLHQDDGRFAAWQQIVGLIMNKLVTWGWAEPLTPEQDEVLCADLVPDYDSFVADIRGGGR